MKSAQLMLASDRGQINPTRSLSQRVESGFKRRRHSFKNVKIYVSLVGQNLSRHMDDVVLLSPMEVATLSAPYEWVRVLLVVMVMIVIIKVILMMVIIKAMLIKTWPAF